MKYEYKYINEGMKDELSGLMTGEHGKTVEAWTSECINAGYARGVVGVLVAVAVGVFLGANAGAIRKNIIDKHTQRTVEKLVSNISVAND